MRRAARQTAAVLLFFAGGGLGFGCLFALFSFSVIRFSVNAGEKYY